MEMISIWRKGLYLEVLWVRLWVGDSWGSIGEIGPGNFGTLILANLSSPPFDGTE